MIRDIVTRVHVVTVRIRDGVTRYALCTHVTPRGSRRVSAVSPTMHSVDDSRSLCEKRVIDVHRLHFRVRGTRKKERKRERRRRSAGSISRESYTLLIPRGKTRVKWREHNDGALITHIAASLFSTAHRQRNLTRVSYINAITITKLHVRAILARIEATVSDRLRCVWPRRKCISRVT